MGTSACKYFQNNGLARVRPHAVSQLISTPPPNPFNQLNINILRTRPGMMWMPGRVRIYVRQS